MSALKPAPSVVARCSRAYRTVRVFPAKTKLGYLFVLRATFFSKKTIGKVGNMLTCLRYSRRAAFFIAGTRGNEGYGGLSSKHCVLRGTSSATLLCKVSLR